MAVWLHTSVEAVQRLWFRFLSRTFYRRLLVGDSRHAVRLVDEPTRSFRRQMHTPEDGPITVVVDGMEIEMKPIEGESDLKECFEARQYGFPTRDAAARLARGEQCLLARHERQLIGCCWFVVGMPVYLGYIDYTLQLGRNECFEGELWVHPDYRGRKIIHALSHAYRKRAIQQLAKEGISKDKLRFMYTVQPQNKTSLLSIYERGGRFPESLVRIKIGPWQRVFRRTGEWKPRNEND